MFLKWILTSPARWGEHSADVDSAGIRVALSAAQGRGTGASTKEQSRAAHPQGMGKAIQQGMFLLRPARASRAGEEGKDEIDQSASRVGKKKIQRGEEGPCLTAFSTAVEYLPAARTRAGT